MSVKSQLLLVLLALAIGSARADQVPTIEVFKLTSQTVTDFVGATVYDVDGLEVILSKLSEGLPASPELAEQMAKARFEGLGAVGTAKLEEAAKVLGQTAHYGLTKAPAVVFDGKYVVYGESSVAKALKIYRAWSAKNGGVQ
ncbi:TIGR03757 family integrating conjugative element protein [Nitrogeniibacter aestuarii]|uniref:TIGR03757 family integrating conjugative element protein n=1 Tax=Nitrogeniibacter aestuarii TaxID=2815343 RepID=UPI001E58D259|nr:TIGR03757 family integrating conjugative element protein [Nitrogeniibacter aestuarii]